jgi:hypothetical protein
VFPNSSVKALRHETTIFPVRRAVDFISSVIGSPEHASWKFGLDTGNCAFSWTNISGYFALGAPVHRARILSRLSDRYKARVIISEAAFESLADLPARKLGILRETDTSKGEAFFCLALD